MFVTVRVLTCSPPSLWVFLFHWVWCSGYSVEYISSACSPDHWLVSVESNRNAMLHPKHFNFKFILRLNSQLKLSPWSWSWLWSACFSYLCWVFQGTSYRWSDCKEKFNFFILMHLLNKPRVEAPESARDLLFTALHELDEVGEQHIPVPLTEAFDIVRHLRGRNVRTAG